eukprot:scaffold25860_cov20-Tisochrysis_lutea.AAC.1
MGTSHTSSRMHSNFHTSSSNFAAARETAAYQGMAKETAHISYQGYAEEVGRDHAVLLQLIGCHTETSTYQGDAQWRTYQGNIKDTKDTKHTKDAPNTQREYLPRGCQGDWEGWSWGVTVVCYC